VTNALTCANTMILTSPATICNSSKAKLEKARQGLAVTNTSIKKRFEGITKSYKLIHQWVYQLGQDAHDKEQELLGKYSKDLIDPVLGAAMVRSGHTEIFKKDVLGLDLSVSSRTKSVGQVNLW
jgi:hypothetical protein